MKEHTETRYGTRLGDLKNKQSTHTWGHPFVLSVDDHPING